MAYFSYQNKKIYYEETGTGKPVVLLHGNTASSKMFELLMPLYERHYKVIRIDFLGHGKSDRLKWFPPDLWLEEARQTIALLEYLNYGPAALIGTSGGAYVAVNVGLVRPDLTAAVVADSFDGRTLEDDFAEKLLKERKEARTDEQALMFYKWCQGEDWESVVDLDTESLVRCAREKWPLFFRTFRELKVPLLLMGSRQDEMSRGDLMEEYEAISKETGGEICMFDSGFHPAIVSNAEKAAEVIIKFLSQACIPEK